MVWVLDFEEKTIRAKLLFWGSVLAFVVFVALLGISEEAVVLGAFKCSRSQTHCNNDYNEYKLLFVPY
jgi:hypothetical protein